LRPRLVAATIVMVMVPPVPGRVSLVLLPLGVTLLLILRQQTLYARLKLLVPLGQVLKSLAESPPLFPGSRAITASVAPHCLKSAAKAVPRGLGGSHVAIVALGILLQPRAGNAYGVP
jgi:hypothetical protein